MKNTLQLDFSNKASNVSFIDNDVIKIWGNTLGWTRQEAEGVLDDHTQYLENLKSAGIQTSEIVSRDIYPNGDNSYLIKEVEKYSGEDVSISLLGAPSVDTLMDNVTADFRSIARLLLSVMPRDGAQYSSERPWFSVPADLKPQNVVIKDNSAPIVIDTFGPKLWLDGKIKPLPTRVAGRGQILNDEVKVGNVRFSLGRLNGYFMALSTRWLVSSHPEITIVEIDALRRQVSDTLARLTGELLLDNNLFETSYSKLLIADASELESRSIEYGIYEGPRYVQKLYEREDVSANLR